VINSQDIRADAANGDTNTWPIVSAKLSDVATFYSFSPRSSVVAMGRLPHRTARPGPHRNLAGSSRDIPTWDIVAAIVVDFVRHGFSERTIHASRGYALFYNRRHIHAPNAVMSKRWRPDLRIPSSAHSKSGRGSFRAQSHQRRSEADIGRIPGDPPCWILPTQASPFSFPAPASRELQTELQGYELDSTFRGSTMLSRRLGYYSIGCGRSRKTRREVSGRRHRSPRAARSGHDVSAGARTVIGLRSPTLVRSVSAPTAVAPRKFHHA
jgi:hypothetical protein